MLLAFSWMILEYFCRQARSYELGKTWNPWFHFPKYPLRYTNITEPKNNTVENSIIVAPLTRLHELCNCRLLKSRNFTRLNISFQFYEIHCLAKTWIYPSPYVCTERIFDSLPFMCNKIFLKKIFFKLLNSKSMYFASKTAILPFSNIFQRLTVPPKSDQFWWCQKKRKDVSYHLLQSGPRFVLQTKSTLLSIQMTRYNIWNI